MVRATAFNICLSNLEKEMSKINEGVLLLVRKKSTLRYVDDMDAGLF